MMNTIGVGNKRVAIIGTYSPRRCGIATFTADMAAAILGNEPDVECLVVALNDADKDYDYPAEVVFEIEQEDVDGYVRCAAFLNESDVDVVCLQHEYGIFGGEAGRHVLELLRRVRAPIVVTLHTVLESPSSAQRAVVEALSDLASKLVVMSSRGAQMLTTIYGVPPWKVQQIPHGVPVAHPEGGIQQRERLGLHDRPVMLTFGLLSPDKGIEHVIEAMPRIVEVRPDAAYVIVGATHPHIRSQSGEAYRESLEARAKELGVHDNVVFVNEFVSLCALTGFLAMADIYVTPYLKREQITSGTLAYAIGSGKAVISTPYWYAEELLTDGRGILVPPRDSAAIATAAIDLFTNPTKRHQIEERARQLGSEMQWTAVGAAYRAAFAEASLSSAIPSLPTHLIQPNDPDPAPSLNLTHVHALTDDTGILQHATFDVPNRNEGYCLDDNARALLLVTLGRRLATTTEDREWDQLETRYLAFVHHAFDPERARFRNFMSYGRQWLEVQGSEDSHGRALWALGSGRRRLANEGRAALSDQLFHDGLATVLRFTSPRAWAYTLMGVNEVLRAKPADPLAVSVGEQLGERLMDLLSKTRSEQWTWFEPVLSYGNARLPEALLATGQWMEDTSMVEAALESLEWLSRVQVGRSGHFEPVGSDRVMQMGDTKPRFDQQPVEASATVSACLRAWRATRDPVWQTRATSAYEWFLGKNTHGLSMVVPATGACYDGLHRHGVNLNQGAESCLSFHLAQIDMTVAGLIAPFGSTALVNSR